MSSEHFVPPIEILVPLEESIVAELLRYAYPHGVPHPDVLAAKARRAKLLKRREARRHPIRHLRRRIHDYVHRNCEL